MFLRKQRTWIFKSSIFHYQWNHLMPLHSFFFNYLEDFQVTHHLLCDSNLLYLLQFLAMLVKWMYDTKIQDATMCVATFPGSPQRFFERKYFVLGSRQTDGPCSKTNGSDLGLLFFLIPTKGGAHWDTFERSLNCLEPSLSTQRSEFQSQVKTACFRWYNLTRRVLACIELDPKLKYDQQSPPAPQKIDPHILLLWRHDKLPLSCQLIGEVLRQV